MVVIAHPSPRSRFSPADLRHQGHAVSVVLTDDIYDEFSFGERNPQAIRDFLQAAAKNWTAKPKYLLLTGDASIDPRNFLGLGDFDFVPTRMIPTAGLMTASDDWFSDFSNNGLPTLAMADCRSVQPTSCERSCRSSLRDLSNDSGAWTSQASSLPTMTRLTSLSTRRRLYSCCRPRSRPPRFWLRILIPKQHAPRYRML